MNRLLFTIGLLVCLCITMGPNCSPVVKAIPKAVKSTPKSVKSVPKKSSPAQNSGSHLPYSNRNHSQQEEEEELQYYHNQSGGVTAVDSRGNIQGYSVPNRYGGVDIYDANGRYQGNSR